MIKLTATKIKQVDGKDEIHFTNGLLLIKKILPMNTGRLGETISMKFKSSMVEFV